MKFNHQRADAALYAFVFLCLLLAAGFGLIQAWRYQPVLAALITLLIAIPIVAGFWPDKKE